MIPIDDAADKDPSTGVRRITNPAAGSAPVTRRAAPGVSLGGRDPAVSAPGSRGKTSPYGQDRERAGLAGMPDPETGGSGSCTEPGPPVRGRGKGSPAGGEPASRVQDAADSVPPDRSPGLRGKEAMDAVRRAQSALNADRRRARFRRAAKQPGAGSFRLPPPEPPRGAA